MRRFLLYAAGCVGGVGAGLAVVWALHGFVGPELPLVGLVAMGLGMALTVAVAIALMALVFYSDRSGHDEIIYRGDLTRDGHGKSSPSGHS